MIAGKNRGSGVVAVKIVSTLAARVLKLKICSSKDVFLFTGCDYTDNCSERDEESKPRGLQERPARIDLEALYYV